MIVITCVYGYVEYCYFTWLGSLLLRDVICLFRKLLVVLHPWSKLCSLLVLLVMESVSLELVVSCTEFDYFGDLNEILDILMGVFYIRGIRLFAQDSSEKPTEEDVFLLYLMYQIILKHYSKQESRRTPRATSCLPWRNPQYLMYV